MTHSYEEFDGEGDEAPIDELEVQRFIRDLNNKEPLVLRALVERVMELSDDLFAHQPHRSNQPSVLLTAEDVDLLKDNLGPLEQPSEEQKSALQSEALQRAIGIVKPVEE